MKTLLSFIILFYFFTIQAQEILTVGEVYNFEPGDQFQLKNPSYLVSPNAVRLTITGKAYSANRDSVFYTIARDNYTSDRTGNDNPERKYFFIRDTIKEVYTNLDSSVLTSLSLEVNEWVSFDTISVINSDYCGMQVYGVGTSYPMGSWNRWLFGKGLGLVSVTGASEECGCDFFPYNSLSMFYFKKGGIECGTPDNLTVLQENNSIGILNIYPVPASQLLNVEFTQRGKELHFVFLLNSSGIVLMYSTGSEPVQFDVSSLPDGMYFVRIETREEFFTRKVVIQ
jgi:hypothetical protein